MAKDPAFLFYHHDFIVGTAFMSLAERGAYITILCYMADKGPMLIDEINKIIGAETMTDSLRGKFKIDDQGRMYNERLQTEVLKRKAFCESRRTSRTSSVRGTYDERTLTYDEHTENRNRNENKDVIGLKDFDFIWSKYPIKVKKKMAQKHFISSVKTKEDLDDLNKALANYLGSKRVMKGFVYNADTFFNNWRDWVDYKEEVCKKCQDKGSFISTTGYQIICDCVAGKRK